MAPVGVIGLCDPDGHGDLATARAAAATGVPMVASTLMQDPLEDVAAALGDTPGYFQLYPPDDRELTESFVHRAEAAGYAGIVVTLDTLTLGWRPRDLALGSFPQLRGLCLANYFTDPVFRAKLAEPPEEDQQAATGLWASLFGDPALTWADLDWLRSLTRLPLLLKGICRPGGRPPGRRRRGGRDLLLQPRRPAGQRWAAGTGLPARRGRGGRRPPGLVRLRRTRRRARGQGAGPRRDGGRRRPALRVRAGGGRAGRHRARAALPAGRDRPHHGRRRVPADRRPDPGRLRRVGR